MKPLICPHCKAELEWEINLSVIALKQTGWRAIPLKEMHLSVRAENCCRNEGLKTAGEIDDTPDSDLLRAPNFGKRSLWEIRDQIARLKKEAAQEPHK